jgi:hypothetical protein
MVKNYEHEHWDLENIHSLTLNIWDVVTYD